MLKSETNDDSKVRRERIRRETDARNAASWHHGGERLVRMRELKTLVGLGRSTIYRLVAEGRFPPQIHPLANRISAWRYSEVAQWIADRSAGRPA